MLSTEPFTKNLKPGGRYVFIDHAASVGTATSDAQTPHRINPAAVRHEAEAAGFDLEEDTPLLASMDDPHSLRVFDPVIKGHADRFTYCFVKP